MLADDLAEPDFAYQFAAYPFNFGFLGTAEEALDLAGDDLIGTG